jgi:hypothetical protein
LWLICHLCILLDLIFGVCKAAFVVEDAMSCLPKLAKLRLVEKVCSPQLILAVRERAIRITASSGLEENPAQPGT